MPFRIQNEKIQEIIKRLNFRHEDSTIIAVVQDHITKEVLMVANMNKEALRLTLSSGFVHFWSLSRKKIWKKGETSGNLLELISFIIDCDNDALLLFVRPYGPVCHKGERSCFHQKFENLY